MPTLTKRKHFAETVTISAATATSLESLMKTAGYGFLKNANNDITTEFSLDSFLGYSAGIKPLGETLYAGNDRYVRGADGAGPPRTYKGAEIDVGDEYHPVANPRGIVDPASEFFYSVGSQDLRIIFHAI